MFERRAFLRIFAAVTGGAAVAGCGAMVSPDDPDSGIDAGSDREPLPDAHAPPRDGATLLDARVDGAIDASDPNAVVLTQSFSCTLEDRTCSGHNHSIRVEARAYRRDEVVRYMNNSSHQVEFTLAQLIALKDGRRIPFSTSGAFDGHAHCGLAFRSELGPTMPVPTERCTPLNTVARCVR